MLEHLGREARVTIISNSRYRRPNLPQSSCSTAAKILDTKSFAPRIESHDRLGLLLRESLTYLSYPGFTIQMYLSAALYAYLFDNKNKNNWLLFTRDSR